MEYFHHSLFALTNVDSNVVFLLLMAAMRTTPSSAFFVVVDKDLWVYFGMAVKRMVPLLCQGAVNFCIELPTFRRDDFVDALALSSVR